MSKFDLQLIKKKSKHKSKLTEQSSDSLDNTTSDLSDPTIATRTHQSNFTDNNLSGAAICFGLLLRAAISLHSYSGEAKPPMYGDFEAQRHWQEICVNMPAEEWYKNSSQNNLMYWGLDYPPLTAYHSFLIGQVALHIDSKYVALQKSRGISKPDHKYFMRTTVLFADLFLYIPAIILFTSTFRSIMRSTKEIMVLHIFVFLTYSGQILIDNGHFQYNNVSLGFTLLAAMFLLRKQNILGAFFFCLALNYKQMELYHALPFFFLLLRKCFITANSWFKGILNLLKISMTVIFTFAVIWLPWLKSFNLTLEVLKRLFPIARGVFEDKVANVWCILNVILKFKKNFSNEIMAIICLITTILAVLPSCFHLMLRPKNTTFMYSLINVSLSFFLFSFQVHEKSILLVAIAILMVFPFEPFMGIWFLQISTFSMFPLLVKDGLSAATVGLSIISSTVVIAFLPKPRKFDNNRRKSQGWDLLDMSSLINTNFPKISTLMNNYICFIYYISLIINTALCFAHLYIKPPENLPHIFPLIISASGCSHLLLFYIYFNYRQISEKD